MPTKARPRFDRERNQWTLYHDGKKHYLCAGAANEEKAWAEAAKLRGDRGEQPAAGRPQLVCEAIVAWVKIYGVAWHAHLLIPFNDWAGMTALDEVHDRFLADYLAHLQKTGYTRTIERRDKPARVIKRPYAARTIQRQLRFARTVLQWAHGSRYMSVPVPAMPKRPRITKPDRSIDRATLARIFARLPRRAGMVLAFAGMVAARPHEVCKLTHEEIRNGHCYLTRGKTYRLTGEPRIIPLVPAAQKIIDAQSTTTGYVFLSRRGTPYTESGLRSIFKRAAARCGVEVTGPYQLRHSWAQAAFDSGLVTLDEVGAALGHADGSKETSVYAHVRQQHALAAVSRFDSAHPSIVDASVLGTQRKSSAPKRRRRAAKDSTGRSASGRGARQAG